MKKQTLFRSSPGLALGLGLALFLGAAGCAEKSDAVLDDMGAGTVDLSVAPTEDLSSPPGADLAKPGDLAKPADLSQVQSCRGLDAPGTSHPMAAWTLKLPTTASSFKTDLDGDGRTENQLLQLVNVVALAGLDIQTPLDDAVASGTVVNLVALRADKTDSSACAGVLLSQGEPRKTGDPAPKYDGTDVFSTTTAAPVKLAGKITAGKLATTASKDVLAADDQAFALQLSLPGFVLTLPLHGVHIEGTVAQSGSVMRINNGVLSGAVSQTDIDMQLVPALATVLTQLINGDPTSSTAKAIIGLFESKTSPVSVTKCMTASKCCQTSPATCVILPEEVKASPIGGVLSSDVQVFDGMGRWAPTPGGTMKNGLSVGVGFSSVTASF